MSVAVCCGPARLRHTGWLVEGAVRMTFAATSYVAVARGVGSYDVSLCVIRTGGPDRPFV